MTLAADTPWAASVSGDDSLVNYASNLSGLAGPYPGYLGPIAGGTPGPLADYDPDYEDAALQGEVTDTVASFVTPLANAVLGAIALPAVLNRFQHDPTRGAGTMLAGAAVGALLGWQFPVWGTLLQTLVVGAELAEI